MVHKVGQRVAEQFCGKDGFRECALELLPLPNPRPQPPLHPPVQLPSQRPQQPLMDLRFSLDYFRQVKQLLLNIRRQVQQAHDLRHPRLTDSA